MNEDPLKRLDEKIARQKELSEQTKARLQKLVAKRRDEERRRDNHRKIVAGAILLKHADMDPEFRKLIRGIFDEQATTPRDRALLDLPPLENQDGVEPLSEEWRMAEQAKK